MPSAMGVSAEWSSRRICGCFGAELQLYTAGKDGPLLAALPGGQQGAHGLRGSLPGEVASAAHKRSRFRLLSMDRVNCTGSSSLCFSPGVPEAELHAEHLLDALRSACSASNHPHARFALIGSSSGARVCLIAAHRFPSEVACVVACDPSTFPEIVAGAYYDVHVASAKSHGLRNGVALSNFYQEIARHNPGAPEQLEQCDVDAFIRFMEQSSTFIRSHAPAVEGVPVNAGLSAEGAQALTTPVLVCHSSQLDDQLHPQSASRALAKLIPSCQECIVSSGPDGIGINGLLERSLTFIEEHVR